MFVEKSLRAGSRLSVFVDADNIPFAYLEQIREVLANIGPVGFFRVYGNENAGLEWRSVPGTRFVLSGAGKNAADMIIAIEATARAVRGQMDHAVLVSSDSDFSPLALSLREWGISVTGVGEAKTPESFRAACETFHLLSRTTCARQEGVAAETGSLSTSKFCSTAKLVLSRHGGENGLSIYRFGQIMAQHHGAKIKSHPDGTWRAYFQKRLGQFELDAPGIGARVRLRALSSPQKAKVSLPAKGG